MILDSKFLSGFEKLNTKFVRVGNDIFIMGPEEDLGFHVDLARREKVLERLEHLKEQDKDNVDGGMIYISGRIVRVGSASTSLGIPLTDKARKLTIKRLQMKYPSLSIKELSDE